MLIEIKIPSVNLVPSFLEFKEALKANGDPIWGSHYPKEGESHHDFIKRLIARETHPEASRVAETIYWGAMDGIAVGRISIRHELNEELRILGGHIGYEVHPLFRNRGVATTMLREILKTPKAIEIGNLLLTCHPENIASNKTILANGGELEKKTFVESQGEYRNYYWIKIKTP